MSGQTSNDENYNWKGVEISSEEMKQLSKMVTCISGKYTGYARVEFDDLVQELWIKALSIIRDCGSVNLKLIARSLYNKAIDVVRYMRRRNDYDLNPSVIAISSDRGQDRDKDTTVGFTVDFLNINNSRDDYSIVVASDIVELFDKGTRARKYVLLVAKFYGVFPEDSEYLKEVPENFTDMRPEKEFATILGYKDDTSNGYRSLKRNVREIITWYFEDYYKVSSKIHSRD